MAQHCKEGIHVLRRILNNCDGIRALSVQSEHMCVVLKEGWAMACDDEVRVQHSTAQHR